MVELLLQQLQEHLGEKITRYHNHCDQLTLELTRENLLEVAYALRDLPGFQFEMLVDLCGVDYLDYGRDEWKKDSATLTGFSRGVMMTSQYVLDEAKPKTRFAVVYHLLSLKHNQRLRLKVFVPQEPPLIDSVIEVWNSANWYEREAFDLYGILFTGHPDLRRLLTDYGFIGYPFRKDFPLIGQVEIRYDAASERCVYEPVDLVARTLVPKVIRDDHRYLITEEEGLSHG